MVVVTGPNEEGEGKGHVRCGIAVLVRVSGPTAGGQSEAERDEDPAGRSHVTRGWSLER